MYLIVLLMLVVLDFILTLSGLDAQSHKSRSIQVPVLLMKCTSEGALSVNSRSVVINLAFIVLPKPVQTTNVWNTTQLF